MGRRRVAFEVNGSVVTVDVEPRELLSDVLREQLDLRSVHVGCEQGVCGACTVLIDGVGQRSCLLFAVQMDGRGLATLEGLATGPHDLHAIQQAMWDHHGVQCGFCTPGVILTALDLLSRDPAPGEDDIRRELAGNLCRCTGYVNIVEAVKAAAARMRKETIS